MTTECLVAEYGVDTACRGEVRHIGEIVPLVLARYLSSDSSSGPHVGEVEGWLREPQQSAARRLATIAADLTRSGSHARARGARESLLMLDAEGIDLPPF